MKAYLILTFSLFNFYNEAHAQEFYFSKNYGYTIDNTNIAYKSYLRIKYGLTCLAYCIRESNCLAVNYREQTNTCSLYDCRIDKDNFIEESSSIVYTIKGNLTTHSFNFTQPSTKVNSLNGTSMTRVYGIVEIIKNNSYFIITDRDRDRDSSSVVRLNDNLDQNSIVIDDISIEGIFYDFCTNNIYIASYNSRAIYVYHTDDEVTFTKIATISSQKSLYSITIQNNKIYSGTGYGTIQVQNKLLVNYSSVQVLDNMCSTTNVLSVKFDCNGNMIYSCYDPPMVKIMGMNGINTTLLLNDTFSRAYETYIDSKNRLWVGGNNGIIVYN